MEVEEAENGASLEQDSLTRAQELTSQSNVTTSTKSFYRDGNEYSSQQTKSKLISEMETERKHRQDLESHRIFSPIL